MELTPVFCECEVNMVFAYGHRLARSNKDVSYVKPWVTIGITAETSS